MQSFVHWLDQRGSVPLIQALNARADDWRAAEIARAQRLLARGESVEKVLDALSRGLTQKMLHGALAELHPPPASIGRSSRRPCRGSSCARTAATRPTTTAVSAARVHRDGRTGRPPTRSRCAPRARPPRSRTAR